MITRYYLLGGEVDVWLLFAEPATCGPTTGPAAQPTSGPAAARLSWGHGPAELALLDAADRARLARVRDPLARAELLAGRTLLRRALASYLRCGPAEVQLSTDQRGRPCLSGAGTPAAELAGWDVNLSHSGPVLALAVGRGLRVGVDVERVGPQPAAERVAAGCFSAGERDRLAQLVGERREQEWVRIWTRHEAHAKARGAGLPGLATPPGQRGHRWDAVDLHPAPGYAGTLVALPHPTAAPAPLPALSAVPRWAAAADRPPSANHPSREE